MSPKQAGPSGEPDGPAGSAPSTTSDEEGTDTPKAMKNVTKPRMRARFAVPEDNSDNSDNELYRSSDDGAAHYSGNDDDLPIVRSPHRLRSKETHRKAKQQKGILL